MLFDPRWEQRTERAEIERFAAWLETRDPQERYCYRDFVNCAVAQWLKSEGERPIMFLPDHLKYIVNHDDQTFGAAFKRARAALGDMTCTEH